MRTDFKQNNQMGVGMLSRSIWVMALIGLLGWCQEGQASVFNIVGQSALAAGTTSGTDIGSIPGSIVLDHSNWVSPPALVNYNPKYVQAITIPYPTGIPGQPTLNGVPVIVDVTGLGSLTTTGKLNPNNQDMVVSTFGAGGSAQFPDWVDLPALDTRRISFLVYGLTAAGKTGYLYYGDPNYGSASSDSGLNLSTSTNHLWAFKSFTPLLGSSNTVTQQPVSLTTGLGSPGWATMLPDFSAPNPTSFAVHVSAYAGVNLGGFAGWSVNVPLGISSVAFTMGEFTHPATYVGIGALTVYNDFDVEALNIIDQSNLSNAGKGLIYSCDTSVWPNPGVLNSFASQDASGGVLDPAYNTLEGQPLSNSFISQVGFVMRQHIGPDPYASGYGTPLTVVAASSFSASNAPWYAWGFTITDTNSDFQLGISNPLAPQLASQFTAYPASGTWISAPIDLVTAPLGAGSVDLTGTYPGSTYATFATSTSSDSIHWSAWSNESANGGAISSPNSRYIKLRITLYSPTFDVTPNITQAVISYNDTEPASKIYAYPNPCMPNYGQPCNIANIPIDRQAKVDILDVSGQIVRTLSNTTEFVAQGPLENAVWDGRNRNGNWVAPGLYLYRVIDNKGTVLGSGKIVAYQH